jgi:hypothetical protein
MRQEWRNSYEVTGLRYRFEFAALALADYCITFEHIDDGFLFAVMIGIGIIRHNVVAEAWQTRRSIRVT